MSTKLQENSLRLLSAYLIYVSKIARGSIVSVSAKKIMRWIEANMYTIEKIGTVPPRNSRQLDYAMNLLSCVSGVSKVGTARSYVILIPTNHPLIELAKSLSIDKDSVDRLVAELRGASRCSGERRRPRSSGAVQASVAEPGEQPLQQL